MTVDPVHAATLLLSFLAAALFGAPIALALVLAATLVLLLALPAGPALTTAAQRMAAGLDSFVLLAIPLFVLSGELLARGGAARRLVRLGQALLGTRPAGLATVTGMANALFGALSGSAVAAAAGVGTVMVPQMERAGASRGWAASVNLTTATCGLLIPPSNILIVYALASGGTSITDLFLAGYAPGLLLATALVLAGSLSLRRRAEPSPSSSVPVASRPRLVPAFLAALPSLGLVLVVMGGIVAGLFTATEAAGVAVVYSLALALWLHREMSWREIPAAASRAAATSGIVLLLIAASSLLSWVLAYEAIPQTVARALLDAASSPLVVLLLIHLLLLVVGTFLDMTPAVLIFTPIFLPAVVAMGISPVHFGITMVLNLCIGLCTPPVGTVLFVGMGVARTSLREVARPLLPLYTAMIAVLLVVVVWDGWTVGVLHWLGRS